MKARTVHTTSVDIPNHFLSLSFAIPINIQLELFVRSYWAASNTQMENTTTRLSIALRVY